MVDKANFQPIVNDWVQAGQWIEENKGKNVALGATQAVLPVIIALGAALVIYLAVMHGQTGHSWLHILDKSWHWVNSGTTLANLVKFGVPAYIINMILGLGLERLIRDQGYRDAYSASLPVMIDQSATGDNSNTVNQQDKLRTVGAGAIFGFNTLTTAHGDGWTDSVGEDKATVTSNETFDNPDVVKNLNGYRVGGYLPIVSVATGIYRMKGSICGEYCRAKLTGGARVLNFVRGATEMLGLGIVFLLPDIIGGVVKSCRPDKKEEEEK